MPNRTQPANILKDMMGECRQVGRCKETLNQSFLISVLYWSYCEDRVETCVSEDLVLLIAVVFSLV